MNEVTPEYTLKAKHVQELIADAYREGKEERTSFVSAQLLDLPELIKQQCLVVADLVNEIEVLRRNIDDAKNLALDVVSMATENGKPKYSNDTTRKVAVLQILRDDKTYRDNLDELYRKEVAFRKEQIQLDYLNNRFKAYLVITGMEAKP
jgi:hypothetical protein